MRGRRLNDDVGLRGLFTLHYCTIVAVFATSDTARLSRYRYIGLYTPMAAARLDPDPVRGTTVCEVTAMERGIRRATGQSSVHRGRDRVLFIRLFSRIAVRGGV